MLLERVRVSKSLSAFSPAKLAQHERLSFLFKDSIVYGGAMAISRAFSLVTFPIIARRLPVADYGTLDLFLVLSGFLMTSLIFGQDSAVGRFFYEYDDPEERRQVISQSLLIQAVVCIAAMGILFLLSNRLAGYISTAEGSVLYLHIILAQVPFMMAMNFSQNLLKWTFTRWAFLVMSVGYAATQAAILVIAVLLFPLDIETVLFVTLIANVLFGVLGVFFVRQWIVVPRGFNRVSELLRFAVPVGLICLLSAAVPMVERQSIEKLLGADGLGLYAAGAKLAMLLALAIGSFQTAWGPFSVSIHREKDAGETYNLVLGFFCLLVCVLVLMLDMLARPLLIVLASNRYLNAEVVVFPLAMATAVQSISWITEIGIGLSKRTSMFIYPQILFIAVIAAAMVTLIPTLGLLGGGLAMMMAQIVRSCTASWLAQRVYPLPWAYAFVFKAVTCVIATAVVARGMIESWGGWWAVTATYLLVTSGLCLYFWSRMVTPSAKIRIVAMFGDLAPKHES